jgi:hypothetical protein
VLWHAPGTSLTNSGQSCRRNSDSESHKLCAKRGAKPLNLINSGRRRSLSNSHSSGRTRVREMSSASPIGVNFRLLLNERGHPLAAVRGFRATPVRSMNAKNDAKDAELTPVRR